MSPAQGLSGFVEYLRWSGHDVVPFTKEVKKLCAGLTRLEIENWIY